MAHIVFDAVSDPVARAIIESASRELIQLVAVLRQHLELAAGSYTLALAGSVLLNVESPFAALINWRTAHEGAAPADTVPVVEPVRGAVALARRAATE